MTGTRGSSTRAEIATTLFAAVADYPIHLGIDNLATVNAINRLICFGDTYQ